VIGEQRKIVAGDRPTVVIDHYREPRTGRWIAFSDELDVELSVVDLPDCVRLGGFPSMHQVIEFPIDPSTFVGQNA
jgi:hypothetical protein